ncbi:MAG: hypothetical protein JTT11_09050, partial [Candidatus Brockarchaeota archaeon]|nr:hypothetical protein [Candidatus Brockarchaeota archaeon]
MSPGFLVIPSIDVSMGKVVRVRQHRVTGFEERLGDPVEAASFWAERGAERLHVIDIDGSKAGHPVNVDTVRRIAEAVDSALQVGGGVRNRNDAEVLKGAGADFVIFRPRELERKVLEPFKNLEGIILGLDIGCEASIGRLSSFLRPAFSATGARSFLACDVCVEGTSSGPRFGLLESLLKSLDATGQLGGVERIYAGGVSS